MVAGAACRPLGGGGACVSSRAAARGIAARSHAEMSTGPSILLGYAYVAPGDASGIPARIVRSWRINRNTRGDVDAWMSANANNRAWNACAIVKGQKYVYFKFSFKGVFKKKVEVPKEDW